MSFNTDSNDKGVEGFWTTLINHHEPDTDRKIRQIIEDREQAYLDGERDEPVTENEINEIIEGFYGG